MTKVSIISLLTVIIVMICSCGIRAKKKAAETAAIEAYYQSLGDRYLMEFNSNKKAGEPRRDYYKNTDENRLILEKIKQKYANEDTVYFAISTSSNHRGVLAVSVSISFRFKETLDSLLPSVEVLELNPSCIRGIPTYFIGLYYESEGHIRASFPTNKERVLIRTDQWHDEGCDEYETKSKRKRKKRRRSWMIID